MLSSIFVSFQDDPLGRPALALVYSGCKKGCSGHPCPGCHNPELWHFGHDTNAVLEATEVRESHLFNLSEEEGFSVISSIVVMGGEPFDQNIDEVCRDIDHLVKMAEGREEKPEVIVFTGYDSLSDASTASGYGDILENPLIHRADWLKTGMYREDIPPRKGSILASGNQRFFRKRNESGKIVFEEFDERSKEEEKEAV